MIVALSQGNKKRRSATRPYWVLVALVIGVGLGWLFPDAPGTHGFHASDLEIVSTLFLRLIKLLIAPLLLGTLVVGIASHGDDLKRVGTLALRSILYFEVVTTLALLVGLVAVNIMKPGVGIRLDAPSASAIADLAMKAPRPSLSATIEHAVPTSIFDAAARNDALQIVCFAVLFAIGLARVRGPGQRMLLTVCRALTDAMFELAGVVMRVAPFAIGAAVATTVGRNGLGVMSRLGLLVLTLYGALVAFALCVLLPIAFASGVPLRRFVRAVKEPWLLAFTTASSEAALPVALRNMQALGVPSRVASFVLPMGYSFNMDGTALYLILAAGFVAQAAGIPLPLSQQVLMLLTLMLTSKGLAAVPRASLVVLSGTLVQFGLPLQGVAVILGVDAFMDIARTSLNVVGNCLATVLMARWEGSFQMSDDTALPRLSNSSPATIASR